MSYIKDFEAELAKKLTSDADKATLVKWISDKVLESFQNGVASGRKRKGAPAEPKAA